MTAPLNWELRKYLQHFRPDGRLNVLIAMLCHCNIRLRCFVGNELLEEETGFASASVVAAKKWLRERGAFVEVPYGKRVDEELKLARAKKVYQMTGIIRIEDELKRYLYMTDEAYEALQVVVQNLSNSSPADISVGEISPADISVGEDEVNPSSKGKSLSKGKSPKKKKDSADAGAKPRERDLMFDAVAEHIFKITTAEELAAAQAADQSASRAGIIAAWLKGTSDGYTPPNARKRISVGFISAPAKPEHVALFAREWALIPKNKHSNMPLDLRKFVDQWRAWASSKRPAQPAQKPAVTRLTPEQEAERDAEYLRDLEEMKQRHG